MVRILFFLLLLPLLAFTDSNQSFSENEDPTIFHHVNVITGNLNISFQDALVQGAQLTLPPFLVHSECEKSVFLVFDLAPLR